jgi:hypothetical protein
MDSLATRQLALNVEAYRCHEQAKNAHRDQNTLYFDLELCTHYAPGHEHIVYYHRVGRHVVVARTPDDCARLIETNNLRKTGDPAWISSRRPPMLHLLFAFLAAALATPYQRYTPTTQKFDAASYPPTDGCRAVLQTFGRPLTTKNIRDLQAQLRAHKSISDALADPFGWLFAGIAAAGASAFLPANHPTDARPALPGFKFRTANPEGDYVIRRRNHHPVARHQTAVEPAQRLDFGSNAAADFGQQLDRTIDS